jgi:hypothetical protein
LSRKRRRSLKILKKGQEEVGAEVSLSLLKKALPYNRQKEADQEDQGNFDLLMRRMNRTKKKKNPRSNLLKNLNPIVSKREDKERS